MREYEKWFKKAENDLLSIQNNLKSDHIPADVCCFHAQQVAEKYFKAYLVSRNILFPKTHDLELLLKLCEQVNPLFSNILTEVRSLIDYAIVPRYPDLSDDLTVQDAKQALENSIIIKKFILKYFFE